MENENDLELNLDLDGVEASAESKLKVKNRFEKLSEKVILNSKERDDALAKVTTEAEARLSAEKERDFYKDFSVNVSKYPNASEFQDKILEKVKAGYSTEDAMVSVLAKEGKLGNQSFSQEQAPAPQRNIQAEGGSAQTMMQGNKSIDTMSIDEKFAALKEADRTGELARALSVGR